LLITTRSNQSCESEILKFILKETGGKCVQKLWENYTYQPLSAASIGQIRENQKF
jgi:predicted unusual protein kinase regulating ubiquinone biosynthesis (AarF/ABC1/UbiB family)